MSDPDYLEVLLAAYEDEIIGELGRREAVSYRGADWRDLMQEMAGT